LCPAFSDSPTAPLCYSPLSHQLFHAPQWRLWHASSNAVTGQTMIEGLLSLQGLTEGWEFLGCKPPPKYEFKMHRFFRPKIKCFTRFTLQPKSTEE
jgi:hypothetical protein